LYWRVAQALQVQDDVTKFNQAAHSISTTQMAFLRSAQIADCNYQFYTAAFTFSNNPASVPKTSLSIGMPCTPAVVQNQDLVTRQKLMDAITLYADQIQAVASTGSDKTLSTNAQTTAADLNTLAKNNGLLTSAGTPIAASVEAAVIGLSGMVLAEKQFEDIQKAASSQADNLATIVKFLQQENTQLATNMAAKDAALSNILDTTLAQEKQGHDRHLLLDALAAHSIVQNANPAGTPTTVPGTPAPIADPISAAQQLNAALDGLVSANDAIANSGTGGITAAVTDLVARAQAAQAMQAALNK
jgi:hypothetical protein